MKALVKLSIVIGCSLLTNAAAALNTEQAEIIVQTHRCNEQSIDEALKHVIKKHSQRDLGWRVFEENEYVDVERAILVNKGKQIRYRWRVSTQGDVTPISKKAEKLCAH